MNATPVVLPQSAPLNASPINSIGAPAAESAKANAGAPTAGAPTFAGALNDAGAKSTRKPTAVKLSDAAQSGAGLPVPGNPAPPAVPALPPAVVVVVAAVVAASTTAGEATDVPDAANAGAPRALAAASAKDATAVSGPPSATTNASEVGGASTPRIAATFSNLLGQPGADSPAAAETPTISAPAATAAAPPAAAPVVPAESITPSVVKAASPPELHATVKVALRGSGSANGSGVTSGHGSDEESDGPSGAAPAGAGAEASLDESGATAAAAIAAGHAESAAASKESTSGDSAVPALPSASAALSAAEATGASSVPLASTKLMSPMPASTSAASAVSTAAIAGGDKHLQAEAGVAILAGGSGEAAAGLSQLGSGSPLSGTTAAVSTPTLQVNASVGSADFAQGLADRVSWMVGSGVNSAKLQVNPPQLGPIELSISVQGNHALVAMTTHSAVTRDALESSSPKLREMLSAQGFGQVSVDISQRSFQDRSAYSPPYGQVPPADRSAVASTAVTAAASAAPRASLGVLDAYA